MKQHPQPAPCDSAFTLVELSLVLVVVALTVTGILFGRDLIQAAKIRQQASQVAEITTAANAFRLSHGYWPGDIPHADAVALGLKARGTNAGEGDANGKIQGTIGSTGTWPPVAANGEAVMFWVDLFATGMLPYQLTVAQAVIVGGNKPLTDYLPRAKVGQNNFLTVWESGGVHYLSMGGGPIGETFIGGIYAGQLANYSTTYGVPLLVHEAYALDSKMDDGLPQSGRVMAHYVFGGGIYWAAGGAPGAASTAATPRSETTCYDNGNAGGATQFYSMGGSTGNNVNCSLSFRFLD